MKNILITLFLIIGIQQGNSQADLLTNPEQENYKFSILTTYLTFSNVGKPEINTQHYEIRLAHQPTAKDQIGLKFATWKLFAPMGIDIWDSKFLDRDYFYPGRLQETGIGITYQRKLWKGLFAAVELMPMVTSYLDSDGKKVGSGFKLYNSYHLGYQIPLFKKGRFYLEPQLHANHWPINNNVAPEFKVAESGFGNLFLIEPNLYIGMKF